MACKNHQFIPMGETVKFPSRIEQTGTANLMVDVPQRPKHGVKAGCALCGEVRAIYEDGTLEVIHASSNDK
jgi:hypothetical protein